MSVAGAVPRVLVVFLIACYVLLPLDRGFPAVPLFGHPLSSAIAATIVVLVALVVQSRGAVLAYLIEPYSVIQSFYACVLVASAFRAPSLPSALHWSALYFSTFVLNYAILRHVTRRYGTRWLSLAVVAIGLVAAAVAIVQAVPGIRLPVYDSWFENYFARPPENYALPTVRAAGTMNNPIVFCVLMVLVVPYALDVKRVGARSVALFVLMFAAGLTGSRTLLVVLSPFALGALVVYRWRAVRAWPAVSVGVILLLASLGWVTPRGQDSRMAFLTQRFGLTAGSKTALDRAPIDALSPASAQRGRPAQRGRLRPAGTPAAPPPTQAELSSALGISLRQAVVKAGLREMIDEWGPGTWLVGRGTFAAMSLGRTILPWYTTVDNVFLSGVRTGPDWIGALPGRLRGIRRQHEASGDAHRPLVRAARAGRGRCVVLLGRLFDVQHPRHRLDGCDDAPVRAPDHGRDVRRR